MVRVTLTNPAVRQMEDLPVSIHGRVMKILERLRGWPMVRGVRSLRGELAGRFRVRTGDYRVQFRVEDDRLIVERIGHRDGFYED